MSPDLHAVAGLLPARSPSRSQVPTVLIRVPAMPSTARRAGRPTPSRGRRRLRKEVRAIGSTALIVLIATLGTLPLWGSRRPAVAQGTGAGNEARAEPESPPIVSLSIAIESDAPAAAGARDLGGPAILPGYIVPDDGPEEPPHAGN